MTNKLKKAALILSWLLLASGVVLFIDMNIYHIPDCFMPEILTSIEHQSRAIIMLCCMIVGALGVMLLSDKEKK